ncbi:unnamed protein product [Camellia sinensis]
MASKVGIVGWLVVVTATIMGAATAETYSVGGSLGWQIPSGGAAAYTSWAANETFKVGDILGLNVLRNLTSGFIDVHEGGSSDNLPSLRCYTLMMKSTLYQQELLTRLQNQRPAYKGFPLELELLITLGSIHPWLIRTTV